MNDFSDILILSHNNHIQLYEGVKACLSVSQSVWYMCCSEARDVRWARTKCVPTLVHACVYASAFVCFYLCVCLSLYCLCSLRAGAEARRARWVHVRIKRRSCTLRTTSVMLSCLVIIIMLNSLNVCVHVYNIKKHNKSSILSYGDENFEKSKHWQKTVTAYRCL